MKLKLFLLSFLGFFNYVLGQNINNTNLNTKIDVLISRGDNLKKENTNAAITSYKSALAIALDNKNRPKAAIVYKKIGLIFFDRKDYGVAENMYKNSLKNDSISKTAADVYYNLAILKLKQNQQDHVISYLEKSLVLYKKLDFDKSSYNAFLTAGFIYKNNLFYDKALEYLILSYNGYKKLGNKNKLADVCTSIANIQNRLKNHYQALEYHYQALKLEKDIGNTIGMGICYTNIANVNDNLKKIDSAIINYKRALVLLKPESTNYASVLSNLAGSYKDNNQLQLAEKYYHRSIKVHKFYKDTISLLYDYNGITTLYLKNNSLQKVKKYFDSITQHTHNIKDQLILLDFIENQGNYFHKIKDYKSALKYQLEYSNLYQNIYNHEQTEIVQTLQSRFEHKKYENEILKLSIENKNVQLELINKNKNITNKNIMLIIFAFILLSSLIGYYFLIQKQKTAQQNLKIEKLEAIYQGQEIIKKRIAKDLHDIITTNFDGIRLRILALKRTTNLNESIDEITSKLKNINQQIRIISHRLYPLEMQISNQKFTDVIKSRLSEFQLYGNVFVELENHLPEILNSLNLMTQNNFYGILLEILNNVEKHSHATKINISHYKDNKAHLHFLFTDNGIGIKNNVKEGIGLLNIKQRCEIMEGRCDIKKIETGTMVHINFPIKKNI